MRRRSARLSVPTALLAATLSTATLTAAAAPAAPEAPSRSTPTKTPVAVGHGGAVSSVDPDASAIGVDVLRHGGNAVDAAVATAAALGVTEPFSSGLGGGGYFVYFDASTGRVHTVDGRERAPLSADETLFQEDGEPLPFWDAVTSGLSVGTPGTPATWESALDSWGTLSLGQALKPATHLARKGFTVDETFRSQVADNEERFRDFPASAELFLPEGELPRVGSTLRNRDLARTYRKLAQHGTDAFYHGPVARDIVRTVRHPRVATGSDRVVRPGDMTPRDLHAYEAKFQAPTHVDYRGRDVYGMAPSSSGGTTVGEALNIMENRDLSDASRKEFLHQYLEASRLAYADRGRWLGDAAHEDVPVDGLLSQEFADARACLIRDDQALTSPVAFGDPRSPESCEQGTQVAPLRYEGRSTTHLTTADRWGNVVSYTLTIEQIGGSGMTVPGRGFLLNNELTDFSFSQADPDVPDPNLPGPGKRPRSSMSPTIVLQDGQADFALGSPGGSTIITTVLQTLVNRVDRGMSLPEAIAAPRATQRNTERTLVEEGLYQDPVRGRLEAMGHLFEPTGEIGAATAVERLDDGRWLAAAEPERRGGGSAMVVFPRH
ncbi:gamma-glutamyltransferase [Streptomyces sp. TR06-5]|uniref:gamma-glutamyltransferase n=1 Tax=unclassified Streptomyces TaxID=2593676 RepID=UPI0039A2D610